MKILCVQLPNQDPSGEKARENAPLMAAGMLAAAEARGLVSRGDWAVLDRDTADFGGDAAVSLAVMAARPELVAFTLFDYNLDRSLWLARRLRQALPATAFVAGGPEAELGMPLFKAHVFDSIVTGEWEEAFLELLSDLSSRSLKPRYTSAAEPELRGLPDPYRAGILPIAPGRPALIEGARGSAKLPAFRAGRPRPPRLFDADAAPRALRAASDGGAELARLLDPRLDERPDLKAYLKSLAAANEGGIPVECSIDPAAVDEETARLLAEAGVAVASADLASVDARSLDAVGLALDREGFERGAKLLWSHGIVLRPSVYLGLPFQTHEAIIETFDFLGMVGIGQDAELKPMPVSPGSAVRAKSAELGIREFLERPPYWTVETDWMDEDDFLDAVADFEESFDVAWGDPVAPNFKPTRGGFVAFADLRGGKALDALLVVPEKLASSVTLLLDSDDPETLDRVVRAAKDLRRENQYALWQIVLHSDSAVPNPASVQKLGDAFSMPEHYFELSRLYSLDPQPQFQTRLFFATGSERLALSALAERQDLETVFVLGDAMPGRRLVDALPFLAFDRDETPFGLLYEVLSAWRAYQDLLVEAPRSLFRKAGGKIVR